MIPFDPQRAKRNRLANYSVFSVDELRMPDEGKPVAGPYHVMQMNDWVAVVALTPEEKVVLVRQYRVGVESYTLEAPGGVIDKGEAPIEAAERELFEETGYKGTITPLGWVYPNPALQDNKAYLFLATDAKKVAEATFDGQGEYCETVVLSKHELKAEIAAQNISHVIALAALSAGLNMPLVLGGAEA
jgi:8-oxo-dGTP pyrophosphatase MutT (NUDIX family)